MVKNALYTVEIIQKQICLRRWLGSAEPISRGFADMQTPGCYAMFVTKQKRADRAELSHVVYQLMEAKYGTDRSYGSTVTYIYVVFPCYLL